MAQGLPTNLAPNATSVTVASSAGGTLLIGANPTRNGLFIYNRSAVVITIVALPGVPVAGASGFGYDIANATGLVIGAGGTIPFVWTAGIQAIAASSTAVVTVLEF